MLEVRGSCSELRPSTRNQTAQRLIDITMDWPMVRHQCAWGGGGLRSSDPIEVAYVRNVVPVIVSSVAHKRRLLSESLTSGDPLLSLRETSIGLG